MKYHVHFNQCQLTKTMNREEDMRVGRFFKRENIKSRTTEDDVQRSEADVCDMILGSSGIVEKRNQGTLGIKLSFAWAPV